MGQAVLLAQLVGVAAACAAFELARASFYRARRPGPAKLTAEQRKSASSRRLGAGARAAVMAVLHEERFADLSVPEVWAALLDEGRYLCSISTMYRLLRGVGESGERRAQRRHPRYPVPRLVASGPNQVGAGTSPSWRGR